MARSPSNAFSTPARSPRDHILSTLANLAAAALIVVLLAPGLRDVPIARDEGVYYIVAHRVQEWLRLTARSPGEALSAEAIERYWRHNHEHPAVSRFLAAGGQLALEGRVDPVAAFRAGNALLAVLLVLDCFHFMRRRFGTEAAWFAASSMLLIPCLYGHACIAAMDFPAAALGFLATTAFVRGLDRRRWSLAFAFYLALAFNSKINAAFVPVPLLLWALVFHRRACLRNLVAAAVLVPLFWFLTWPWLWHDGAARLVEYFQFHRGHHNPNAVYFGEVYARRAPPWHYSWLYLFVSAPAGILLPAGACVARLSRNRRAEKPEVILLLAALVTPVIVCSLPNVPRYDGPRLFLNAFPFLACIAGVGFSGALLPLIRRVAAPGVGSGLAGLATAALLLGSAAVGLWRIHPFEAYSYYNALVGGPSGAMRLGLSPVVWAMADRRAVDHLNHFARAGDVIYSNTGATLPLRTYRAEGLLRDDLRFGLQPDWIVLEYNLAYSRWREWWALYEDRHPWYERVLQVEVAGAPVLGVFRARASPRGPVRRGQVRPPRAPDSGSMRDRKPVILP